jgi:type IV secretory pathway TraG/TraD family ATPase VirD4
MNEQKKGVIFITARSDQRQTLKPLISAWVDMAINALMVLPEDYTRRLWFIIDELAALQKLPSLQMGLAEGRKYGGCFLVGFQSKPQLEEIYGRQGAESMLDLFNTKVFFRCTEPSTQTWISKVLGDKEEIEPQENISYGANSMRDGVSLSHHTRQKPLVMPTELSQLKDLECYIKLPGDYPCTKLQMTYQTASNLAVPAFLLKPEKPMSYEEAQEIETKPTVKKAKKKPVKQEVIVVPEISEEENEALV